LHLQKFFRVFADVLQLVISIHKILVKAPLPLGQVPLRTLHSIVTVLPKKETPLRRAAQNVLQW